MFQTNCAVVSAIIMLAYGVSIYVLRNMFASFARICCIHAQYLKACMAEEVCCVLYHLGSLIDFKQQPLQALCWEGSSTRSYITVCIFEIQMCIWKRSVLTDDIAVSARQELVSLIVLTSCLIVPVVMIIGRLITRRSSSWRMIVGMSARQSSLSLV